MSDRLDDTTKSVIYHALGWDLSEGLRRIDTAFCEAEDDFDLSTIDDLLDILSDRTLQKEERLAWFRYYSARRALMLGLSRPVEAFLAEAKTGSFKVGFENIVAPRKNVLWECRLGYMVGQITVMGGDLIQGLDLLRLASGQAAEAKDGTLEGRIQEALARAHIVRARSFGGWDRGQDRGAARLLRAAMTAVLFPFYAFVCAYLRAIGTRELWPAVLRYGAEFSNWPIFWHYLNAHRALGRAQALAPASARNRTLRIQIMQADLLRELCAPRRALRIYEDLLANPALRDATYLSALIQHAQAQALLDTGQTVEARADLDTARQAFLKLEHRDQRAAAYIDLLLGDIALQGRNAEEALEHWESALQVFTEQGDMAGLAQVASHSYQVMDRRFSDALQERAGRLVRGMPRRIFPVRVTDRIFAVLQGLTWAGPVLILLGMAVAISTYAVNVSLEESSAQARSVVLGGQVPVVVAVVLVALLCNAAWGIIGLLYTLRRPAIHLDLIAIDEKGLYRYDFAGQEKDRLAWSDITTHLRVERDLGIKPAASLSFVVVCAEMGRPFRLPAATAWFAHLQEEIERHTGRTGEILRLRWFGPLFLAIILLMGVAAAATFRLTEGSLSFVSIPVHTWAASLLWLIVHLVLFWIIGRWPLHFLKVYSRITPASRFVPVVALLGACLAGLAIVAQSVIFLLAPSLILLGTILLTGAVHQARLAFFPGLAGRAGALVPGLVAVVGGLLVLRALLPIVINWGALTYLEAAQKYEPDNALMLTPAERAVYFSTMDEAGRWMVAINPTYPFGHGYIGYADYFRGNYRESIARYSRAINLGRPNVQWDYYQCRAAAYARLGNEKLARQDCATFKQKPGYKGPICETLFPEDALVCAGR